MIRDLVTRRMLPDKLFGADEHVSSCDSDMQKVVSTDVDEKLNLEGRLDVRHSLHGFR